MVPSLPSVALWLMNVIICYVWRSHRQGIFFLQKYAGLFQIQNVTVSKCCQEVRLTSHLSLQPNIIQPNTSHVPSVAVFLPSGRTGNDREYTRVSNQETVVRNLVLPPTSCTALGKSRNSSDSVSSSTTALAREDYSSMHNASLWRG